MDLYVKWMCCSAGLCRGAQQVGRDSCLYAEDFSLKLAAQRSSDPAQVSRALHYYFGALQVPDSEVAQVVYNINTTNISAKLHSPEFQVNATPLATALHKTGPSGKRLRIACKLHLACSCQLPTHTSRCICAPCNIGFMHNIAQALLSLLTSPAGRKAIASAALNDTAKEQLVAVPGVVVSVQNSITALQQQVARPRFQGLYDEAKLLLCCGLTGAAHDLWLTWTAAGALSGALCVLATARIMSLVVLVGPQHNHAQVVKDAAAWV